MASQKQYSVNKNAFFRRIRIIYSAWKVSKVVRWTQYVHAFGCPTQDSSGELDLLNKCDAIVVPVGEDQDIVYSKSMALQVCYI